MVEPALTNKRKKKSRVEKLLKIKVSWEPKLFLGVRQFLPNSWNSLSLCNEEFTSSFRHTWSTLTDCCYVFFFFPVQAEACESVSKWVGEQPCSVWILNPKKGVVSSYILFLCLIDFFFSVFNTFHFLTILFSELCTCVSILVKLLEMWISLGDVWSIYPIKTYEGPFCYLHNCLCS